VGACPRGWSTGAFHQNHAPSAPGGLINDPQGNAPGTI